MGTVGVTCGHPLRGGFAVGCARGRPWSMQVAMCVQSWAPASGGWIGVWVGGVHRSSRTAYQISWSPICVRLCRYADCGELRTNLGVQSAYQLGGPIYVFCGLEPRYYDEVRTDLVLQSAYQLGASICVHRGGGKGGYFNLRTVGGVPREGASICVPAGVASQSSMILFYNRNCTADLAGFACAEVAYTDYAAKCVPPGLSPPPSEHLD